MAATNFAALTAEQYKVWSRDFWKEARNKSFIMAFAGTSSNSMVQRIDELKTRADGAKAVITMVNDAVGDGVVGDNTLKGNEEALTSTEDTIILDQWRHAHRNYGRMSDQKSIVNFREEAKDKLAYAVARITDELAFLTLSGVAFTYKPDGTTRSASQLPNIAFAADVSAPTSRRHYRWDASTGITAPNTAAVDAADVPTWDMLVDLKAKAVNEFIRPIRTKEGVEIYNVFMTPNGIAKLKKDSDFLAAWQHAQKRGDSNPLFAGTAHGGKQGIYVDGLNILEYRNVFHSSTWGSGSNVSGQRVLLCGAQALAFADIGSPTWVEEYEDYENTLGISVSKIFGLLKPKLYSVHAGAVEDFGVLCLDTAA